MATGFSSPYVTTVQQGDAGNAPATPMTPIDANANGAGVIVATPMSPAKAAASAAPATPMPEVGVVQQQVATPMPSAPRVVATPMPSAHAPATPMASVRITAATPMPEVGVIQQQVATPMPSVPRVVATPMPSVHAPATPMASVRITAATPMPSVHALATPMQSIRPRGMLLGEWSSPAAVADRRGKRRQVNPEEIQRLQAVFEASMADAEKSALAEADARAAVAEQVAAQEHSIAEQLRAKLEHTEVEVSAILERIEEQAAHLRQTGEQQESKQAELLALEQHLAAERAEFSARFADFEIVVAEAEQKERQFKTRELELKQARAQLEEEISREKASLAERSAALDVRKTGLQEAEATFEDRLKGLEVQLQEQQQTIEARKASLTQNEATVAELQAKLRIAEQAAAQANTEKATAASALTAEREASKQKEIQQASQPVISVNKSQEAISVNLASLLKEVMTFVTKKNAPANQDAFEKNKESIAKFREKLERSRGQIDLLRASKNLAPAIAEAKHAHAEDKAMGLQSNPLDDLSLTADIIERRIKVAERKNVVGKYLGDTDPANKRVLGGDTLKYFEDRNAYVNRTLFNKFLEVCKLIASWIIGVSEEAKRKQHAIDVKEAATDFAVTGHELHRQNAVKLMDEGKQKFAPRQENASKSMRALFVKMETSFNALESKEAKPKQISQKLSSLTQIEIKSGEKYLEERKKLWFLSLRRGNEERQEFISTLNAELAIFEETGYAGKLERMISEGLDRFPGKKLKAHLLQLRDKLHNADIQGEMMAHATKRDFPASAA